jgi:hypothetical protein
MEGLSNALDALSNDFGAHIDALSNNIDALSNSFGAHIGELEVDVDALETWRVAADPKIVTLQEFDLVFHDGLQNLHDEIDVVAENALNARAALSNDTSGRFGASLYPNDGLQRIGNLDAQWLEEHFGSVCVAEMFVSHPEGGGRRVMYERFEISNDDRIDKPEIIQGEQGEQGPPGISPEDPGYLPPTPLTSALEQEYQHVSNTAPDAGY